MSNQPEDEIQQSETMAAQALREYLLEELEASKQALAELSDEELEEVAGGGSGTIIAGIKATYKYNREDKGANIFTSIKRAIINGPSNGQNRRAQGFYDAKDMLYAMRRDAK